jgi:hypothetical protein
VARDATGAGLERDGAAALGGPAHRAPVVVAQAEGRHARGECGRLASARATGRARRVPGIAGRTAQLVVRVPAQAEVRQVRASDRDGARAAQLRDEGRIFAGTRLRQATQSVARGRAGEIDVLLHRDGYAVQRSDRCARLDRAICLVRRREGLVVKHDRDGIQRVVDRLDAIEMCLHDLLGGRAPGADGFGEVAGAVAPERCGVAGHEISSRRNPAPFKHAGPKGDAYKDRPIVRGRRALAKLVRCPALRLPVYSHPAPVAAELSHRCAGA